MRYLTKEWYYDIVFPVSLGRKLKISKYAETFDEKKYKELYNEELNQFIDKEKERLSPLGAKDIPWIKEVLTLSGAPKEGQEELKKIFLTDADLQGKEMQFDEAAIKKNFDNKLSEKMEISKKLPKEILDEIADLRMFYLGYVTPKVNNLLKEYLGPKQTMNESLMRIAILRTQYAEKFLRKKIQFHEYMFKVISDIVTSERDVYIHFLGMPTLIIREAEIVEQEALINKPKNYFANWEQRKEASSTVLEAIEVFKNNDKYEVHCLMCNQRSDGKRLLWYFTVRGINIDQDGENSLSFID